MGYFDDGYRWHPVRDSGNIIMNPDKPIIIGNNVWIGCRTLILKGAGIANESIVAAGTIVNKIFEIPSVIIAGTPAKIVKKNNIWLRENF